jgi:hypothetical protein
MKTLQHCFKFLFVVNLISIICMVGGLSLGMVLFSKNLDGLECILYFIGFFSATILAGVLANSLQITRRTTSYKRK